MDDVDPGTQPGRNGGSLNKGGNDGNAFGGGRKPANRLVSEELEKLLSEEVAGRGGTKRKNARRVAEAILKHALGGNGAYLKALLDRMEGPVAQKIQVSQLSNEQLIALLAEDSGGGGEEEGT